MHAATAVRLAAVAMGLAVIGPGCSSSETDTTPTISAADCSDQVRLDGVVYTSHGSTQRRASRHSSAEAAECHDVGKDPAGSFFPEDPRQVATWTFPGYAPEKVLGVRYDKRSFGIFVADTVSNARAERILRQLRKPRG